MQATKFPLNQQVRFRAHFIGGTFLHRFLLSNLSLNIRLILACLLAVFFSLSFNPASARVSVKPILTCIYAGARFCLDDKSAIVTVNQYDGFVRYDTLIESHALRIEEHTGFPTLDVVDGGLWRMTYRRYNDEYAILLEQRLNGQTWWSFYLIGIEPVLKITFKAQRETKVWPFAQQAAAKIFSCLPDSRQYVCRDLPILKHMIHGHMLYKDEGMRVQPRIEASFNYIIAACARQLGQPCVEN